MDMERLVELRAAVGRLFYSDDRCFEDYDFLIKNIESLLKENASLQARLDKAVELPCGIGTVVYIPMVSKIGWWQEGYDFVYKVEERKFELCMINDVGKTVFLTEAEAQAKLDEMKGGADKCSG